MAVRLQAAPPKFLVSHQLLLSACYTFRGFAPDLSLMDNASLKPISAQHHHLSTRSRSPSQSPQSHSPSASSSLSSSRTSTRPSTSSLVRPAPARKGQPASSRNFAASSAGGATSHLSSNGNGHSRGEEKGRHHDGTGLSEQQQNKLDHWGESYVPSEETIRNDYSGEYVSTGQRPQNFIRNAQVESRFSEYPKLASLLSRKHSFTNSTLYSIPPTYMNPSTSFPVTQSFKSTTVDGTPPSLASSGTEQAISELISSSSRFDSILLTPPPTLSFASLASLPMSSIASNPGFIWLWVGSGQKLFDPETGEMVGTDGIGLEKGRELLAGWGYRRCEDIVWLKSNKKDPEGDLTREPTSLFTPTVEHCLMGIRGTVRRSTDSWFVHCNVDTDVLVWEGDEEDPNLKPPELQSLIENFCLGTRRLHLFGSINALRRGWLTVASAEEKSGSETVNKYSKESKVHEVEKEQGIIWEPREWSKDQWRAYWEREGEEKVSALLPFDEELDALRPKSPPPRNGQPSSGGLGRGRGAGLGITRSGLVTQAIPRGPVTSQSPSTQSRNGFVGVNGPGRGRGRGSANGIGEFGSHSPAPAAVYSSSSVPRSTSLSSPTTSSTSNSPYRIYSLAPPIAPNHPLPSRPSFTSLPPSGSAHSTHPSQYRHASSASLLAPPVRASPVRQQNQQQMPTGGGFAHSPYTHPQQQFQPPASPGYPSPEQYYYAQLQQHQAFNHFQPQNSALPPHALHPQFSNRSLSQSHHGQHSYPISSAPLLPTPQPPSFVNPSPSISPAISPAISHMNPPPPPPLHPSSYVFPPQNLNHPHPPPSLSSSSSASSSSFLRYANGDELEYPIGGPGSSRYA